MLRDMVDVFIIPVKDCRSHRLSADTLSIRTKLAVLKLNKNLVNEILVHAIEQDPQECCGLIGGNATGKATSVYRTRNVATTPLVTYEAAPEDLFAAQRAMRARGEELI